MKRRTLIQLACLFITLTCTASRAAQGNNPADVMSDFRFLVGAWAPVSDPSKPAKYAESMNYAAIRDGKFLISQEIWRDKDGKIIYKDFAVFGADPDTHLLFLHAYNTDGSIDRTRQIESPAGQWIFLGTVYGSPNFKDYRYTMFKIDDNHIRVLIELAKDGAYQKYSDTQYERKSREAKPEVQ